MTKGLSALTMSIPGSTLHASSPSKRPIRIDPGDGQYV